VFARHCGGEGHVAETGPGPGPPFASAKSETQRFHLSHRRVREPLACLTARPASHAVGVAPGFPPHGKKPTESGRRLLPGTHPIPDPQPFGERSTVRGDLGDDPEGPWGGPTN